MAKILRANMGDIVNLRRTRKQRARAEREATERAGGLDENRFEAHRWQAAGDHAE